MMLLLPKIKTLHRHPAAVHVIAFKDLVQTVVMVWCENCWYVLKAVDIITCPNVMANNMVIHAATTQSKNFMARYQSALSVF